MLVGSLSFMSTRYRPKEIHLQQIESFWNTDAVQMVRVNLPPIDPFNDLDPLLPLTHETQEFDSVIAIPEE